jgi:hypothetical protein
MDCKANTKWKRMIKMKLVIEKEVQQPITLECGDVIETDGDSYLVVEFIVAYGGDKKYIAKSFDGKQGLFGIFNSLASLNEGFIKRGLPLRSTVYKANEYSLKLVKN